MSSQTSTKPYSRKRARIQRRKQVLQSAAMLSLVALILIGQFARQHTLLPPVDTAAGASSAKPAAPALTPQEMARIGVNEAGRFPILEYHEISSNPPGAGRSTRRMHREPDAFRHDLARLYAEHYRPISLRHYLDNKIAVPAGMAPVVLTFDDARDSQFRYLSDGSIDPECAVGILQEFTRSHPDFPLKATFFVLTEWGFGQKQWTQKKFKALLAMGCELQNHTFNHSYFGHMSDAAIEREIARGKASIEQLAPRTQVDMLALPGGQHPHSKNEAILRQGDSGGVHYTNRAVFDAWGGLASSPVTLKFNPLRIPRIEPIEEEDDGLTHCLNYLKTHPKERYVSDGDPTTISVPRSEAKNVMKSKLQNATLRIY